MIYLRRRVENVVREMFVRRALRQWSIHAETDSTRRVAREFARYLYQRDILPTTVDVWVGPDELWVIDVPSPRSDAKRDTIRAVIAAIVHEADRIEEYPDPESRGRREEYVFNSGTVLSLTDSL